MERLDKILANTGRWSRKEARELVRAGAPERAARGRAPPERREPRVRAEPRRPFSDRRERIWNSFIIKVLPW